MKTCIQVDRIIGLDGTGSPPVSIVIDEAGFISDVDVKDNEPFDCRLLDRRGYTALPLLTDCHIHLGISNDVMESPDFHRLDLINGQLRNYLECGVGHVHSLGTDQPWLQEELDRRRAANNFKQVAIGYSAGIGFGALGGWPGEFTRGFVLKHPRKLANRSGNSRNAAPAPSKSGSTISGVKCRSFRYPSHAQSLMRLGAME